MRQVIITVAAVLAGGVATMAQGGNLETPPPPPPVAAPAPVPVAPALPDWTGGYVGAQAGYGFGEVGDVDADGFLGGLYAGYRYDFGRWVLGGELDYNLADLSLDDDSGEIDEVGRLKLQAGYKLGRALLYGTAGAAYASADVGGDLSDTGWAAGVGLDYLVTQNITAGVEYLYHDFSDFDDTGSDVTVNTVSARIGYKF